MKERKQRVIYSRKGEGNGTCRTFVLVMSAGHQLAKIPYLSCQSTGAGGFRQYLLLETPDNVSHKSGE